MKLNFRTLKADEIDVRVGNVDKDKKWITLLLYKDSRVDMSMLDEIVGPMDWQRQHVEFKGNIYCGVSIWDEDKKIWVTKWDAGKESNTESEKGEASDSFKRACVNWGLGRELYTSPKIFLYGDSEKLKYDTYSVKEIEYDSNKNITKLVIIGKDGNEVYTFPKSKKTTTKKDEIRNITKEQITKIHTLIGKNDALKEAVYKKFGISSSKELTEDKAKQMIKILEDGIAKKKKQEE